MELRLEINTKVCLKHGDGYPEIEASVIHETLWFTVIQQAKLHNRFSRIEQDIVYFRNTNLSYSDTRILTLEESKQV